MLEVQYPLKNLLQVRIVLWSILRRPMCDLSIAFQIVLCNAADTEIQLHATGSCDGSVMRPSHWPCLVVQM